MNEVRNRRSLICTAPNDCFSETFTVVDDRDDGVLELTCVDCGHTQEWELGHD